MQECLENDKAESSRTPQHHIVRRHRDILGDYSAEFSRTFANISNQLQRFAKQLHLFKKKKAFSSYREELMSVETGRNNDSFTVNNRCRPSDYLMRENESISELVQHQFPNP